MDRTIERLAREERRNELCRLQSEVARLKLEVEGMRQQRNAARDHRDYEVRQLQAGLLAASHLLKAANGPDDGPTSWSETHRKWYVTFSGDIAKAAETKPDV